MKSRKLLLVFAVNAILILMVLLGFEIYLRKTVDHFVQERTDFLQSNNVLVRETADYVRPTSSETGDWLIPNIKVRFLGHKASGKDVVIHVNSLGMRGPEILDKGIDGRLRILILGDSITNAEYLPDEETYVKRMEHYLNDMLPPSSRKVEVINGGAATPNTQDQIAFLEKVGLSVKPDVVLVGWYLNDSTPIWGFRRTLSEKGWLRRKSLLVDYLFRNFRLFQWMIKNDPEKFIWPDLAKHLNWMESREDLLQLAYSARYDWGAAWQTDSWEIVRTDFKRLRSLAQRHHFEPMVASFPVRFQVYPKYIEDAPQRTLQSLTDEFRFPYLDLLPVLRENNREELFYDHCHINDKAHDLVALKIAKFLKPKIEPFLEKH